jgi:hypothetical protein
MDQLLMFGSSEAYTHTHTHTQNNKFGNIDCDKTKTYLASPRRPSSRGTEQSFTIEAPFLLLTLIVSGVGPVVKASARFFVLHVDFGTGASRPRFVDA